MCSGFGVGVVRVSAVQSDFEEDRWPSASGYFRGKQTGTVIHAVPPPLGRRNGPRGSLGTTRALDMLYMIMVYVCHV